MILGVRVNEFHLSRMLEEYRRRVGMARTGRPAPQPATDERNEPDD